MAPAVEVQSTLTPTGTAAIFKENPDRVKARAQAYDQKNEQSETSELGLNSSQTKAPENVQFGLIRHPRLLVTRAIPVNVHRDGEVYVASWDQAEEFGYGSTRSDALEDFGKTIAQLFITLERETDTLGAHLQETLELLRAHLRFRG